RQRLRSRWYLEYAATASGSARDRRPFFASLSQARNARPSWVFESAAILQVAIKPGTSAAGRGAVRTTQNTPRRLRRARTTHEQRDYGEEYELRHQTLSCEKRLAEPPATALRERLT